MHFYWSSRYIIYIILLLQTKKDKGGGSGKAAVELNPWPDFIQERLNMWDRLKKEADESLKAKVSEPIKVGTISVVCYYVVG